MDRIGLFLYMEMIDEFIGNKLGLKYEHQRRTNNGQYQNTL